MYGRAMEPRGRKTASLAAAMAATWWANTAAADPEPPVVAPPSYDAASDGRSEQVPVSPSTPPATEANAVPSEAPPGRLCATGGCPKETAGSADPLAPALTGSDAKTRWYGYQNMLVDLGGITLAVVAVNESSGAFAYLALATYLLGSPSVHWGHGQVGMGFGSLAIRVVAPTVGAGLGCLADNSNGEFGCLGGFVVGGLVGGGAAMLVDYAVFAHEEVPKEAAKRPRLTPSFALVPESGHLMPSVGLGGTF
jgi:hypothetical protein